MLFFLFDGKNFFQITVFVPADFWWLLFTKTVLKGHDFYNRRSSTGGM
jgi:hypothetical protein